MNHENNTFTIIYILLMNNVYKILIFCLIKHLVYIYIAILLYFSIVIQFDKMVFYCKSQSFKVRFKQVVLPSGSCSSLGKSIVIFLKDDGRSNLSFLSVSINTIMLNRVSKKGIIFPVHSTVATHSENIIHCYG